MKIDINVNDLSLDLIHELSQFTYDDSSIPYLHNRSDRQIIEYFVNYEIADWCTYMLDRYKWKLWGDPNDNK